LCAEWNIKFLRDSVQLWDLQCIIII
jgi:hypothetical protein